MEERFFLCSSLPFFPIDFVLDVKHGTQSMPMTAYDLWLEKGIFTDQRKRVIYVCFNPSSVFWMNDTGYDFWRNFYENLLVCYLKNIYKDTF